MRERFGRPGSNLPNKFPALLKLLKLLSPSSAETFFPFSRTSLSCEDDDLLDPV